MHVRCPHCASSIDTNVDDSLQDLTCPSCGSTFNLIDSTETVAYRAETATIGHFELVEQVGVGQFGTVWRARDSELDRTVAVKVPRKGQLSSRETEQFLREARAAAQLRHPYIVSVHEVGRTDDSVYIVSDFVQGVTLSDWLTGQRLTPREAAEMCRKVAEALEHAHEAGVVHRDMKPGNIMITAAGEPRIMDFGLAKRETGEVTMTADGQVLGTPAYMSPEQARGEAHQADRRSDVYSLGAVLFQLLTQELPFRGNSRMILHQVLHEEAPSPRSFNVNVPRDLETICLKCLEKEPDRRYETAGEVAEELQRFLRGEPIKARPTSATGRFWRWARRKPVLAGLTLTVIGLLLFVAISAPIIAWRQAQLRADAESNATQARKAQTEALAAKAAAERRRREAEAAQYRSRTKVLEAYENLGQARYNQARVLWNDRAANRQELALRYLKEAGRLAGDARRLAADLTDDRDRWRERTDRFWRGYIPLVRSEAVRWLTQTSVQELLSPQNVTFGRYTPNRRFYVRRPVLATNPAGDTLAVYRPPQQPGDVPFVDLIDVSTGAARMQVPLLPKRGRVYELRLAFSADGKRLLMVTRERSGFIRITPSFKLKSVNLATGNVELNTTLKTTGGAYISSSRWTNIEFTPDRKFLLIVHPRGQLPATVHETATGRQLQEFPSARGMIARLTRDGRHVVRQTSDDVVETLDVKTGKPVHTGKMPVSLTRRSNQPHSGISPDGKWVVAFLQDRYIGGSRRRLRMMLLQRDSGSVRTTRLLHPLHNSSDSEPASIHAFSDDGRLLTVATNEWLYLFSIPDGALLFSRRHPDINPEEKSRSGYYSSRPPWQPESVEFSSNGARLVLCLKQVHPRLPNGTNYAFQVWDVAAAGIPARAFSHEGRVTGVEFGKTGESLITAGANPRQSRWGIDGNQLWAVGATDPTGETKTGKSGFDPTGRWFVRQLADRIDVWEARVGRRTRSFPRGRILATDDRTQLIALRDAEHEERIRVFNVSQDQWAATFRWNLPPEQNFEFAFSPDGRFLHARGAGLRIGDVAKGTTVIEETGNCRRIAYSQDGKRAAALFRLDSDDVRKGETGSTGPLIRCWNLDDGNKLAETAGGPDESFDFPDGAFAPDGQSLVFVTRPRNDYRDFQIGVWLLKGQKPDRLETKWSSTPRTTFAAKDRLFVYGGRQTDRNTSSSAVELWDLASGKRMAVMEHRRSSSSEPPLLGSPHRAAIRYRTEKGEYRTAVWDTQTGKPMAEVVGTPRAVSPDGRYLLTDAAPFLLDLKTCDIHRRFEGSVRHGSTPFAPVGEMFVTHDRFHRNLLLWTIHPRKPQKKKPLGQFLRKVFRAVERTVSLPVDGNSFYVFSPDGKTVVTGRRGGETGLQVWNAETGKLVRTIALHTSHNHFTVKKAGFNRLRSVSRRVVFGESALSQTPLLDEVTFSPDGKLLAFNWRGEIRIVDFARGEIEALLGRPAHRGVVNASVCSPDGKLIATASSDHTVGLRRTKDGRHLAMLDGYDSPVNQIVFSADGDTLVTLDSVGRLAAWSLQRLDAPLQGRVLRATFLWQAAGNASALAAHPRQSVIATGHANGRIVLRRLRTGETMKTFSSESRSAVAALACSPDGEQLVSADSQGTLRLWDLSTGRDVAQWNTQQAVNTLAVSPDSQLIATVGNDLRLWRPGRRQPMMIVRRHTAPVRAVAFSPSGDKLATGADDQTVYVLDLQRLRDELQPLHLQW